jgi:hypothetical protein
MGAGRAPDQSVQAICLGGGESVSGTMPASRGARCGRDADTSPIDAAGGAGCATVTEKQPWQ